MGGVLLKLKNWWQAADKTQKLITVFGGAFLLLLLLGTFVFASKPKMSLVFTNLSPADAGSVAMEVENMGIPVSFDNAGNVQVPSDKVAKVRASLAMNGKLPKGNDHFTSDELDKLPMFATQKVEQERLNAIKESDLAQSISVFDGVAGATVKITPAIDSPFETEKKPAQANVTISEKVGELVSADESRAMANLVASAVPGLDKGKVTIFTRSGRALWDGEDMADGSARASNKLDLEKQESRKRRDELQETLNRMLGAGNAIAMVDASLDTSEVNITEETNKVLKDPQEFKKVTETLGSSGGGAPSIGAGFGANDPASSPTIGSSLDSGKSDYSQSQIAAKNPVDKKLTTTKKSIGDLKSMAITILVNKTDKMDDSAIASIQDLANSYLGAKLTSDPDNFTAKVVAYPFDKKQEEEAAKAEAAVASSGKLQQIISILPIAALLIAAFMVVKAISKISPRVGGGPQFAMAGGAPSLPMAPQGELAMSSPGALNAYGSQAGASVVVPEALKQKAIEAGVSEEQLRIALEEAGDAGLSVEDIPSIKNRVNVPLEQIKKMANERPEAVAMLIKSWLIEDGIRR